MEQESVVEEYADDLDQQQSQVERKERDEPSFGTSLRDRMKARKEELSLRTTEIFPVPRWGTVIAVELKAIPWERTEKIAEKMQRSSSKDATGRMAAEELVEATVGFYEVKENDEEGGLERIEDVYRWSDIVERLAEHSLPDGAPPKVRERVALVYLTSDQGAVMLNTTYRQWLAGADVGLSKELGRDFEMTG